MHLLGNRAFFIAALSAAVLPTATQADDAAQWTGAYVGLSGNMTDANLLLLTTREGFGGDEGFGAFAGYDYAVSPNIVVGAEVALYDTEVYPDRQNFASGILQNLRAVNARVGYARGNTLFFAGMGYMVADLESVAGIASPSDGAGLSGFVGIEGFVTDQITIRLDITRATLSDFESTAPGFEVEVTGARVGVAWRF